MDRTKGKLNPVSLGCIYFSFMNFFHQHERKALEFLCVHEYYVLSTMAKEDE